MKNLLYFLFILALGLFLAFRFYSTDEGKLPKNQFLKFTGVVKNEPRISGDNQVIKFADISVYTKLYPLYHTGDKLQVEGFADEKGRIFRPKIGFLGRKMTLSGYFSKLKLNLSQNIKKVLPAKEAALVQGTILGIDNIEADFREELIKTGTIHVVVVSGQNLMIVAGIFLSLVKYFGRRFSLILAILAVFFYAFLTGFEPPVVRASLVVLSSSVAIFFGRESSAPRNLFLAAGVILIIWPRAIGDISFQLTFAASLGIVTLGQRLSKTPNSKGKTQNSFTQFLKDAAIKNGAIATSAYVFTAPVILFYFGRILPVAPLVNILVAELVAPVMIGGFLLVILGLVWAGFAQMLAILVYLPATLFVRIVSVFSKLPFSQINFGQENLLIVILLYLLMAFVSFVILRKNKAGSSKLEQG